MSDVEDFGSYVRQQTQQRAMQNNAVSFDSAPDQAMRATELGDAMNEDPGKVYDNLEEYERAHKIATGNQIISENPQLTHYVAKNPFNAKISNDDWGNLDAMTKSFNVLGMPLDTSIARKAIQGFREGFGDQPLGWAMTQLVPGYFQMNPASQLAWKALGLPLETLSRTFGGGLQGLYEGGLESLKRGGMEEQSAQRLMRDLTGMAENELQGGGVHPPHVVLSEGMHEVTSQIDRMQAKALYEHIRRGIDPPPGISPMYDMLRGRESELDIKNLKDLEKAAHSTSTIDRSKDKLEEYAGLHSGDASIGISAKTIREIYGEKVPSEDDKLLGWIPGIREQLPLAEASGGDVHVPLAKWLANTKELDPEIMDRLHDNIRVRPGGVTLEEAENLEQHQPVPKLSSGDTLHDTQAEQGGLHPLFDQDRVNKLEMVPTGEPLTMAEPVDAGVIHNFQLHDQGGKSIGNMSITEMDGGKSLHVNWLSAGPEGIPTPNSMGPRVVRDLLAQVKARFPEAENITAFRSSGARKGEGGDVKVNLEMPSVEDLQNLDGFMLGPKEGIIRIPGGYRGIFRLRGEYSDKERQLVENVNTLINRILPEGKVQVRELDKISGPEGGKVLGTHTSFADRVPLITWSLTDTFPEGTAKHEAVHFLRRNGFFTSTEWSALERAAQLGEWKTQYNVDKRYKGLDNETKLEEAIAEGYKYWKGREKKEFDSPLDAIFAKLKDFLEQIKKTIGRVLGKDDPTFEDVFERIDKGELAKREGTGPLQEGVFDVRTQAAKEMQPELPGTRRIEDQPLFGPTMPKGMNKTEFGLYLKNIQKDWDETQKANLDKALAREKTRQTKEWKDNRSAMRKDVGDEMLSRPDIAADEFFRKGMLRGERISGRLPKLSREALTPEQRKSIPDAYQSEQGLLPDDVAGLFGYQSGTALVERLSILDGDRRVSGLKGKEYLDSVIDRETDRKMDEKYGDLDQNVMTDARDQALSKTKFDYMHQELMALAAEAKQELPMSKEAMEQSVKQEFGKQIVGGVDSSKSLTAAGRADRAAQLALLQDKPADAFKAKQQNLIAAYEAKEAVDYEKERAKFDKTAKRLSEKELPSVDQDYTEQLQDILQRLGLPIRRSPEALRAALKRQVAGETLADFVNEKNAGLREIYLSDILADPNFKKPLDSLTVDEFRDINKTVQSILHAGRDEKSVFKEGEEAARQEIERKLIDQLLTFPVIKYTAEGDKAIGMLPFGISKGLRTFGASHLQIEALFNRIDRGNPNGPWTQYVMRDLAAASNAEAAMEKRFANMLKNNNDKIDLSKKIDNDVFLDPYSRDAGAPYPIQMTRRNLRAVLLNIGNPSNMKKLAEGYHTTPELITGWLNKNATKEDWDWAQGMWNIFKELKEESDRMYRRVSGVEPDSVQVQPLVTPHGTYEGGYYPLIAHPVWSEKNKASLGRNAIEAEGYYRASTWAGYTKERTGASYPLDLDLDMGPIRMKQIIHDVSFREAVINASKVIYNSKVINAFRGHYGDVYANLLMPWLRDVANSANYNSAAAAVGAKYSEFFRQNIIGTLIGFNPGTVMKHGPTALVNSLTEVGAANFAKAMKGMFSINDATGTSNWQFAMDASQELQRRTRHYNETLAGAGNEQFGREDTWRQAILKAGASPVAWSDLMSAVPTWLAQYEKATKIEGMLHGDAVAAADRAVRRAHGSTAITNRAEISRQGPLASWFTSLYGFFSHILNRQYELMWRANDTLALAKQGDWTAAKANVPRLTTMLVSYVIAPALIEETVSGFGDPREGLLQKSAWGLLHSLSASWTFARDLGSAIAYKRDPQGGLISTSLKAITDTVRDTEKKAGPFGPKNAGTFIQHGLTAFGAMTGYTNAQEGRTAKGIYNYATGIEHPKGFGQWWKLLRTGSTKEPRR